MDPHPAPADLYRGELGFQRGPPRIDVPGRYADPGREVLARGRAVAVQIAAQQGGAGGRGFDVREWMAQPLVEENERRLVAAARRHADDAAQRQHPDTEMYDSFSQWLVRAVRAFGFPGNPLCRCEIAGDTRGDLFAEFADRQLPPGQDSGGLGGDEIGDLVQSHAQRVQRRFDSGDQAYARRFGGR